MKTTHLSIACLFVITGLISCSSNDEEKQEAIPGTGPLPTVSAIKPVDTMNVAKQTNVTTALNPAHGAPGHRCDIAVGAPLNSAAVNSINIPPQSPAPLSSSPIQMAPNNSVKPAVSNTAPVTAGLNPAHGAPGHRCDIAVGAPLNSAPSSSTPAQAPIQITPPTQPKINNTNAVTAGLNPAHGQPGHDCSIPVGQPLKQKN